MLRVLLVAALTACALAWAGTHAADPSAPELCDWQASRDVRRVTQQLLLPLLDGAALPSLCPLAPEADRLQPAEASKEALAGGRWRCRQCGKRFWGEAYVDAHLAARHPWLLRRAGNASCLADWHAALHADHLVGFLDSTPGWAADPLPCLPSQAQARRAACLDLAERCSGGSGGTQEAAGLRRLHALLAARLCQAHTCDKRRKRLQLEAAVRGHRPPLPRTLVAAGTAAVALAAFWLLLLLVQAERHGAGRLLRRMGSLRRWLEAVAADGCRNLLPRSWAAGKAHVL